MHAESQPVAINMGDHIRIGDLETEVAKVRRVSFHVSLTIILFVSSDDNDWSLMIDRYGNLTGRHSLAGLFGGEPQYEKAEIVGRLAR